MQMKEAQLPLLTLETWTPVAESDLLGLTLQHEFNYTNVLELSTWPGACARGRPQGRDASGHRRGPATADFLPLTPFFDAFVVGDGRRCSRAPRPVVEAKDKG
jgi:hypothetical protein